MPDLPDPSPARVLVVNAGSSSLKLAVLDRGGAVLAARTVERWSRDDLAPLRALLDEAGGADAVGHRVVHGGGRYEAPVLVDDAALAALDETVALAPLHNPPALAAVRAVREALPGVPAVACFDTAFHATLPAAAATYALPRGLTERYGLRRYGFHGLSHAYAARRGAELAGRPLEDLRAVTCHLGAGASLAAVRGGRSVDTTMGFTPLEGLVMVTRSGTVDPGMLLWLLRQDGVDVDGLERTLLRESGLAGLSGTSGDLRDVLAARDAGDDGAALAYDVFVHRLAREAAAMTAATGGLDLLVLTGGIGEHSAPVRRDLAARLAHLGAAVDDAANDAAHGDAVVSPDGSPVAVAVVTAREDLEIARQVREVVAAG
ncbi:acetate/propionate family kinase [Vallicoccus soli]|uniref:acetate/propionate family kinase n=1 Tax=Vallicoccus soli TaxID=2339232 RepID=UPI001C49C596|nr:acetate/propionate family kinase [Vallicoccus soli]